MRRLSLLAAAAAAVAALAFPAGADPVTLTVVGRANAQATYVLTETVTLSRGTPTFFGTGSYLGAVVERVYPDSALVVAALRSRALGDAPLVHWGETVLPPGRYVVHLLSDRQGRVSFTMDGLQGLNWETLNPVAVRVTTASAALAVGATDTELKLPGGVPTGRRALLAHRVTGERVEQTYSCVTFQSTCPPEPVVLPQDLARVDPPATVPSATDGAALEWAPRAAERRHAYVGVHGARLKADSLRGVLVVYGR